MKKLALLIALVSPLAFASDTWVQPYTTKDGTYVPGHYRSHQNNTKLDNYSTQGNTNPYTGERGTVNPYAAPKIEQPKIHTYEPPRSTYSNPYDTSSQSSNPYEPYAPRKRY